MYLARILEDDLPLTCQRGRPTLGGFFTLLVELPNGQHVEVRYQPPEPDADQPRRLSVAPGWGK